jgi:hypothetical protein
MLRQIILGQRKPEWLPESVSGKPLYFQWWWWTGWLKMRGSGLVNLTK